MHPFWNTIVNLYPRWLAPNILTFVGFLCLIANFILFSIHDYHFYGLCYNQLNCTSESQSNSLKLFQTEAKSDYTLISSYLCSCIPSYLWLLGGLFQFLSHHLGNFFFFLRCVNNFYNLFWF